MKKILLFLIFTCLSGALLAQTGVGWAQQRSKVNFKDSINIDNGWMIEGTIVLPDITEINYLNGVTSGIQGQINLKLNISDTATMLTPYIRAAEVSGTYAPINSPVITGHPTIEGVTSTGATGTGNLVFSASPTFTGTPLIGTFNVAKLYTKTATLTAGAVTDITLTGVTTKPYGIMIQTTGGNDITSQVSDSLALTGGVYHLHVYSVDLITDAEIKVTH